MLAVHHQWASHQPSAAQATSVKPKILWLSVIHYIKFHLSLATYIPPRNLWMCIYICVYIYVCVYVYIYTQLYIYICNQPSDYQRPSLQGKPVGVPTSPMRHAPQGARSCFGLSLSYPALRTQVYVKRSLLKGYLTGKEGNAVQCLHLIYIFQLSTTFW